MTEPKPTDRGRHAHPDLASIREVQAVKDDLLKAIAAMEARLMVAIREGFDAHNREHGSEDQELRRLLAERDIAHDRYDSHIRATELRDATSSARWQGREEVASVPIKVLRYLNEFRWLVAIIAALLTLLFGHVAFFDNTTP